MKIFFTSIWVILTFSYLVYSQDTGRQSERYKNKFLQLVDSLTYKIENHIGVKDSLQNILNNLKKSKFAETPKLNKLLNFELQLALNQWDKKIEQEYVVKAGDNLWSIAQREKIYNNAKDWFKIYNANKEKIDDPNKIFPNQKLTIVNPIWLQKKSVEEMIQKADTVFLPQSQVTENKEYNDIEIEGLIVDQTQTKLGHDFYDIFYKNWQPPKNAGNFTIIIEEKPLPQLGTQVTIKVNDNDVFQQILQPRYDVIEQLAEYGVQLCTNYVINYQQIQRQLSGNDMSGSGIF